MKLLVLHTERDNLSKSLFRIPCRLRPADLIIRISQNVALRCRISHIRQSADRFLIPRFLAQMSTTINMSNGAVLCCVWRASRLTSTSGKGVADEKQPKVVSPRGEQPYVPSECTMLRVCFDRTPMLVVRELDQKLLRRNERRQKASSSDKAQPDVRKLGGTSEQALRASLRTAILALRLQPLPASRKELSMLRKQGVVGRRAPSCSLLSVVDGCKLLRAFGKEVQAGEVRAHVEAVGNINVSPL